MPYPALINDQEKTEGEQLNQRSYSQPIVQSELLCQQKLNHQETNLFKTKKINNDKNRSRELIITHHHFPEPQPQTSPTTSELDHTYTGDQVPKR